MPNQEDECLTISVESAAKLLGISRGLAYEMVRQKKIPALHFGRIIRVPRYALESLLNAQGAGVGRRKYNCRSKKDKPLK